MAEESGVGLGANPGPSLTLRATPGFVILRAVSPPEGSDLGVETWSFADVEYDKRINLIRNQSIK